jgi:hypothetical protein
MRKTFVIGLTALTCLIVLSISCGFSEQILASSVSPDDSYHVEVTQKRKGLERYVYLNVSRNGQSFVRNKLLYTGDQLDNDFRNLYPSYTWISNTILKVGQTVSGTQANEVEIKNETASPIRYLLIETYRDKYVLFDIAPGADIKIQLQFTGRLSCQGEFTESKRRFGGAVRLTDKVEHNGRGDFRVRINEEKAVIENESLNLEPVTCCAVDRPDINHEGSDGQ